MPLKAAGLAAVLPWLYSSTCHLTLLVALVLVSGWARREVGGNAGPRGVDTVLIAADPGSRPLETAPPSPSPSRYDGVATSLVEEFVGESLEHESAGEPQLHPLLSEPPNLTGVDRSAVGAASRLAQQGGGDERSPGNGESPGGSTPLPNGYVRTGVFGVESEGRKFAYVFDRSGSMDGHGGTPLSAAKTELIASLRHLDSTHQFQIIFYNESPRVFNPTGVLGRLVFGTDANKALAERFVASITADGATRHEEALVMALRMAPDVLFFLTDADEPRLSSDQLARLARKNQGTIINTIEFGYGPSVDPDNFLVQLAQQSGGQHVYVDVSRLPQSRGE